MKKCFKGLTAVMMAFLLILPYSALAAHTEAEYGQMADLLAGAYGGTSAQYALMDQGEIIVSGISGQDELDHETMFGIGSTSKMFTAAVIMKLTDEGLVELDKPVTAYIPAFTMADERYQSITVRMLLNHSSGIMGSSLGNSFLWEDNDTSSHDNLLDMLSTQRLKADPGAYSVYCNDGFTLAEIVAEQVTGKDFTTLIREFIAEPLGLDHTKTPMDDVTGLSFAPIYIDDRMMPRETTNVIGTGGVYSTAEELVAFGQIFTGEVNVLSEKSRLATMEKEYAKGLWLDAEHNTIGYGLGWDSVDLYPFSLYGITALVKGGDTLNYHASLIVLPEYNMSAAVVSSGGASSYNQMMATQLLLDRLEETGAIQALIEDVDVFFTAEDRTALDFDPAPYEGYYMDSANNVYHITIGEAGNMSFVLAAMPAFPQTMYYCGEGKFADATGTVTMFFEELGGNLYIAQEAVSELPGLGKIRMAALAGQKVPEASVEAGVMAAWEARDGSTYWIVSETYSSQYFIKGAAKASIEMLEALPGYVGSARIVDENKAAGWVMIPMMYGRDMMDYEMRETGGVEYLYAGSMVFINENGIHEIYGGDSAYSTIQENGYARWYRIGDVLDGKTITVSCPDGSGFVLLDEEGSYLAQSAVTGEFSAILETGALIAFIGEAGDVFELTIQ